MDRVENVKRFEKDYLDRKKSRKQDRIRHKSDKNKFHHSSTIVSSPTDAFREGWDRMMAARKAKEEVQQTDDR